MQTNALRLAASRLPKVGMSPFVKLAQLTHEHQAISLGQGLPDFSCDEHLQQPLTEAIAQGHNQYAPMTGIPDLVQAIVRQQAQLYGKAWDPEKEITITSGATEGLMAAILAPRR